MVREVRIIEDEMVVSVDGKRNFSGKVGIYEGVGRGMLGFYETGEQGRNGFWVWFRGFCYVA